MGMVLVIRKKNAERGISAFVVGYVIEGLFQIIPFVAITIIIKRLVEKEARKTEIFLKLVCMLIPVSFMTAYWLFNHIDPFARGLLLFINFGLALIGLLVGTVADKTLSEKILKK
ncbi:MAG: hypothetical protein HZB31_13895 [Nitrospirae bacterium]|nr:hypothetical protein [Nitrospirota bacterium]